MTNGATSGREAGSGGDGVGLQAGGAWASAAAERGRRSKGWRRRLGTESGRGRAETKLTLCGNHDIMRNVGGPAKKPRKLDGCRGSGRRVRRPEAG
jgi:hypothetical protein